MSRSSFYFDPEASGSAVFLGPTETRLMELAWRHKRLTVKKVLYHLGPNASPAYTTVMTVLSRLCEKGLLLREKVGRTYEYSPAASRETFLTERIELITTCLARNFGMSSRT